jgi:hypothetical protein
MRPTLTAFPLETILPAPGAPAAPAILRGARRRDKALVSRIGICCNLIKLNVLGVS